ncbi:MAG: phosphatidate cytidylyltransferase [Alistipes sp.]|nr:phosphatidate cytidylyltransferase [Alistipes sp.]
MSDKLKNFIVRTLSGAVLLLVILGAMWVGYYGYLTLLLFITVAGTWEFYSLAKAKGYEPQRSLGVAMATLFYVAAAMISIMAVDGVKQFADNDTITLLVAILAIVIILFVAVVFVAEIFRNRTTPIANISTTIAGVGYVALPMALMTVMPMLIGGNGDWRAIYFLFYLFLVWGNDIFAYLAGVTMGRHKMCERLSPKKSWEGFVGGVLGSLAVGAVGAAVLDKSYVVWMGLALIVSLSSVVGDLVESMFKRDAGVKDSGNIIPGHGGILDRFDAFIISVPFAFVYILIVAII